MLMVLVLNYHLELKAVTDEFYDQVHPEEKKDIKTDKRIETTIKEVDTLLRDEKQMKRIFGPDNYEKL